MSVQNYAFTTGSAPLPDLGTLSYNTVTFSSLYHTKVSGRWVKDAANRTVRYFEINLEATGVVTRSTPPAANVTTTDQALTGMLLLLNQQAGRLEYSGRGFGSKVVINDPNGTFFDVAWGPVPEVLDFQPLGNASSAYVTWRVTARLNEYPATTSLATKLTNAGAIIQLTVENDVTYDDEGYSTLSKRGTLEIPLTRATPETRSSSTTVDDYRASAIQLLFSDIDLTRFRVTRRHFSMSRDRRTMDFDIQVEEIPPMGDPPGATNARGRFTVRPAHTGGKGIVAGFAQWLCSLSITYVIRRDLPRRVAYLAFVYMVWYRMQFSRKAFTGKPGVNTPQNTPTPNAVNPKAEPVRLQDFNDQEQFYANLMSRLGRGQLKNDPKAFLVDFGLDEGMHRDSKTITFEASWLLFTTFPFLLQSCGVWRADKNAVGGPVWAQAMQDIQGWRSWEPNSFDPESDVIVDMGM